MKKLLIPIFLLILVSGETRAESIPSIYPRKGVFSPSKEIMDSTGASWYHTGKWCDGENCVPTSPDMSVPPKCPERLIVGDSPNSVPPYGVSINPKEASRRVANIRLSCPNTFLIAGNVSVSDWGGTGGYDGLGIFWLNDFLYEYHNFTGKKFGMGIGVSCRSYDAYGCVMELGRYTVFYRYGIEEIWVTSFSVYGDESQWWSVADYVNRTFDYYAAFSHPDPGYLSPSPVLIDLDGLTFVGKEYRDFPMISRLPMHYRESEGVK